MIKKMDPYITWMLLGIPILFIIATPLHFLYDWSGENIVVGLFTPVNESIWEHLKLTYWPILIWWIVGYIRFGKNQENAFPRSAVSCVVAEIECMLFIIAFFYSYTGAFGIESLILDILALFLGLLFAILLAVHVINNSTPGTLAAIISVGILIMIAGMFIFFTFVPPQIPLFMDSTTGAYGI